MRIFADLKRISSSDSVQDWWRLCGGFGFDSRTREGKTKGTMVFFFFFFENTWLIHGLKEIQTVNRLLSSSLELERIQIRSLRPFCLRLKIKETVRLSLNEMQLQQINETVHFNQKFWFVNSSMDHCYIKRRVLQTKLFVFNLHFF